ncbi:hypothetical protein ACQCU1_03360 [Sutcliffiella horikoshii]|uniref:hypothetical protein n=1 Tax=Sutcliffiella horikoshii TaxID=79883 RepID=UPI003CF3547C
MNVIEKVRMLNLGPFEYEMYQKHLFPHELDGVYFSKYKYIIQPSIIQLIQMDIRNKEYFKLSLLNRLIIKWQGTMPRLGWI